MARNLAPYIAGTLWLTMGIGGAIAGSTYVPADSASTTTFSPANGTHWPDPDPATVTAALDDLASRAPAGGGQPLDATLTALAGATCSADRLLYCDGSDTVASVSITAAGRAILDDANAAAQLATLGAGALCTGSDAGDVPYAVAVDADWPDPNPATVEAAADALADRLTTEETITAGMPAYAVSSDSEIAALAGLTSAADKMPYFTGSGTAAVTTVTSAARGVLDDATTGDMLTSLGSQPVDADLTALAGLTSAANKGMYFTGIGTAGVFDLSQGGRAIGGVSWSSGTQVPALTAAGTATMLTVGTGANNVAQLDGSGVAPSPYAADSWDYTWVAADGDPTSVGWSQGGAVNTVIASTTQDGVSCYSLTPPVSSGTSYIRYTSTAATGAWEMRLKAYFPVSSGTSDNHGFIYNPDTTQTGTKRYQYMFTATTIAVWNGTGMTNWVTVPDLTGRWIDITIRTYVTGTGLANTWQEIWVGKLMVWQGMSPTSLGATLSAGDIDIGRLTTGTVQDVIYIASVRLKHSGVNAAPPSYTFRDSAWPL